MSSMLFLCNKRGRNKSKYTCICLICIRKCGKDSHECSGELPGPGRGGELRGEWMEPQAEARFLNVWLFRTF